ncbi:hypothetical protein GGX14DRAFT_677258 [Mycena pura]|uniref:Uncharacterized protein n=1 Tax=Mycena pura TaxID=153505 RepID=A0AAD6UUP2_9AGAR|nr:hypothetical protein GGX14DRAFT_677258 [Mycena pura]
MWDQIGGYEKVQRKRVNRTSVASRDSDSDSAEDGVHVLENSDRGLLFFDHETSSVYHSCTPQTQVCSGVRPWNHSAHASLKPENVINHMQEQWEYVIDWQLGQGTIGPDYDDTAPNADEIGSEIFVETCTAAQAATAAVAISLADAAGFYRFPSPPENVILPGRSLEGNNADRVAAMDAARFLEEEKAAALRSRADHTPAPPNVITDAFLASSLHLQQASTSVYATPDGPARIPNFASTSSTVPTPFSCCFRRHLSCHIARKFHDADKFIVHKFLTATNGPAMPKMPVHNRACAYLQAYHPHPCTLAPAHTREIRTGFRHARTRINAPAPARTPSPACMRRRQRAPNARPARGLQYVHPSAQPTRMDAPAQAPAQRHPHGRTGVHARRGQVARTRGGQGAQRTAGHVAGNVSHGGQRALTRLDRHLKNRARPGTNTHIPAPGRTHACARTPSARRQPAPASMLSHTHPQHAPGRARPPARQAQMYPRTGAGTHRHQQRRRPPAPLVSHTHARPDRVVKQWAAAHAVDRGPKRAVGDASRSDSGPARDRGPRATGGPRAWRRTVGPHARGGGPFIRSHGGWTLSSSTYDV